MLLGTFELNSLNSTFPGWPFTKLQEVINPEFHDIKTWERNKWMLNRRQEERYGTGNSVTERRDWPTAGLVAWYCPRVNPGTVPRSRFPLADLDCCQWRGCEVQTGGWRCEGGGRGLDITTYPPCPVCWVWSWPAAAHPPHTEHTLSWPARQHLTGHVLHNTHNIPLSHLQRHTRTVRRHLIQLSTSAS